MRREHPLFYLGAVAAIVRAYEGPIKALIKRYQPLLRLYSDAIKFSGYLRFSVCELVRMSDIKAL